MTDSVESRGRTSPRRELILEPLPGFAPAVGWGLAAMADARRRTVAVVAKLDEHQLERARTPGGNSPGTLLYHLAGVEMGWLYTDLLQVEQPAEVRRLLPWPLDDDASRLVPVVGVSKDDHVGRLGAVREHFLEAFAAIDDTDYVRPRTVGDYQVTPAWACFHLAQHEAHHRSQIAALLG